MTMYSIVCLPDHEFQVCVSPVFAPLESLINLLSNDVTNSIFYMRFISLQHVIYKQGAICQNVSNPKKQTHISNVNYYPDLNYFHIPLSTSSYKSHY